MPQDDWKFTAPTDLPEAIKAIILKPMIVDGIYGLGCSPDNGITNRIYWTIYGRKFYQEDADRLWPFLIDKVKAVMSGSLNVDWSDIQNKPDVATQDDLKNIELKPGPQGQPGTPGKDGQPGKDGKSAYQIAVDNGFVGSEAEWLESLHGKDGATTSGGDASLSIEAITDLIKQHIHALVDTNNGQLTISTDDVSNGSIADAVATKVVSSMSWKMDANGELIAEVGGE